MSTSACARSGFEWLSEPGGPLAGDDSGGGGNGDHDTQGDPDGTDSDTGDSGTLATVAPVILSALASIEPNGLARIANGQVVAMGDFRNPWDGTRFTGAFTIDGQSFPDRHGNIEMFAIGVTKTSWQQLYGQSSTSLELRAAAANSSAVFSCGQLSGSVDIQGQAFSSPSGQRPLLTRQDPSGDLTHATLITAGTANAQCSAIAANNDVVVIGGLFGGTINPGSGGYTAQRDPNGYVGVYDASSLTPIWQAAYLSPARILPRTVAIAGDGSIYVGAHFDSAAADFGSGSMTPDGGADSVLLRYAPDGQFAWALRIHGTANDQLLAIAPRPNGGAFACVTTWSPTITFDSQTGPGNTEAAGRGNSDIAVAAYDPDGTLAWSRSMGGPGADRCNDAALDTNGEIYFTGFFTDTITFTPGSPTERAGVGGFIAAVHPNGDASRELVFDAGTVVGRLAIDTDGVWALGTFNNTVTLGDVTYDAPTAYSAFIAKVRL